MLKIIDAVTLVIVIVGGINWGLIGLFEFDMLTTLYGPAESATDPSAAARMMYAIVGLAAVYQAFLLVRRLLVPNKEGAG